MSLADEIINGTYKKRDIKVNATNNKKQVAPVKSVADKIIDGTYKTKNINITNKNYYTPTTGNKLKYIGKSFGTGVHQGTAGIAQGLLTDSANEMQKGRTKDTKSLLNNLINAYAGNDLHHIGQSALNTINEGINIINDKDKNLWQKAVDLNLNVIGNGAKVFMPMAGLYSSTNQLLGKYTDTDKQLLEWNDKIEKPIEEKRQELAKESEQYDGLTNFVAGASQSIGNMVPSITATAITRNPNVGLAAMGASVKGQATQEALNKGMDIDKATQIGDAKALIEVATEKLSGGAKIFGKGSLDDIAEDLVKKGAKSKFGRFLLTQVANTGGEILEEEISDVLGNAIDKGTTDPDKKIIDGKEALETMGSTAFTTTMLNLLTGGMVNDYRNISNDMNQYRDINTGEVLDRNTQDSLKQAEDIINESQPIAPIQQTQNQPTAPVNNLANNNQSLYNNSESESGINGRETEAFKQNDQGRNEGLLSQYERGQTNDRGHQGDFTQQQEIDYIRNKQNHIADTELTEYQKNIKDRYEKIGIPVNFYELDSKNGGKYDDGSIYINTKGLTEEQQAKVAMHEYAHHKLRTDTNFQNEISPIADRIIKLETQGQSEAIRNYIMDRTENITIDELNDVQRNALEEILADYIIDIDDDIDFSKNNQYGINENILNEYKDIVKKYLPQKIAPIKETSKEASFKMPPINNTQGETVNWNEIERPEGKVRKHYKSIIESSNTTAEAKKIARELIGSDTYVARSNNELLNEADRRINTAEPDTELNKLLSKAMNNEKIKDVDIAVGERLIEYYSKIGDKAHLQDAIHATAMAGTQAGRTVQAMALLNHMTPQGQVVWLDRSINKMNNELQQKYKNRQNVPQFELTPEMQQKIMETTNQEEMNKALDEVYEELGQQVPKTLAEQIDEWRYFSMLANIKTHGRNMIGNFAMGITQRVKNKVAGAIEGTVAQFNPEMERTHTLKHTSKEVKQFAKKDVLNADVQTELGMNENKYTPQSRLQNARKTFKSNTLNNSLGKLFDLNSNLLEVEDNIGLKSMYVNALGEYITANNIDVNNITDAQLQKARKHAIKEAQEATFHQSSALATALNQMGRTSNIKKFALDAAVPFKKTPINVAKTGVQYSPVGLIKSAVFDIGKVRRGNISVNEYIDNISKGLTGTGITFLGYALAQAGILKASGGDDDKKEKYDEEQGKQKYSIEIGGKTATLDWLSPAGIPLFIGAEINQQFNQTKKEKTNKSTDDNETLYQIIRKVGGIGTGLSNIMNPMTEMSMVSGLTSILSSYNKENAVGDVIVNTGKSYINQFVPTALGQLARTTDEYERTTKSTKTGTFEKAADSTINQIKSKVPGLRQTLPIKTDIWGKEIKQSENLPFKAFNNFINPSTIKDVSTNKVDKELNNLYSKTKNGAIIPKAIENKFTIDGTDYRMSNKEYAKYYKNYGKTSYNLIKELISNEDYKSMNTEQKEKAIENVYSYAKEKNKVDYAKANKLKVEPSTLYNTMEDLKKNGGNQSSYLQYIAKTTGIEKESERNKILAKANFNTNTKSIIYRNGTGKDDKFYNLVAKNSNLDINEYLNYKIQKNAKAFESDKNKYGNDISGSAKKKLYTWVNTNITGYENRLLILGYNYKLSNKERNDLTNYINKKSLTDKEAIETFKKLSSNYKYVNGKVYYK